MTANNSCLHEQGGALRPDSADLKRMPLLPIRRVFQRKLGKSYFSLTSNGQALILSYLSKKELLTMGMNKIGLVFLNVAMLLAPVAFAQPRGRAVPSIRDGIDESKLVSLGHNTRPEAIPANDRGRVSGEFPMGHILLQLKRSPEREAEVARYIDELHDSASPNFHKWLTPDEFADSYGIAQADVETVSGWLKSHGFSVNGIQASGLTIDFSGTADQVTRALHTEIHNLEVNGAKHFANMTDPKIPAALAPVVAGIVSLHNFHPTPLLIPRGSYTFSNTNGTFHALVPGDIATIYDMTRYSKPAIQARGRRSWSSRTPTSIRLPTGTRFAKLSASRLPIRLRH